MAPTTAAAQERQSATGEAQPPVPAAAGAPAATSPDGAAGPGSPARPVPARETDYSLLRPPSYDDIVGGVPPSPYASLILLGGILCLVASAVGTATGADMSEWWILGAMLVAVAVFLAGFVSRGA